MLYYDRVAMIEIINPSKSTRSKECMICHNRFFNRGLNFQDSVSKGCHDSTMLSVHISDIVITTIKMLIIVILFMTLSNPKLLIH